MWQPPHHTELHHSKRAVSHLYVKTQLSRKYSLTQINFPFLSIYSSFALARPHSCLFSFLFLAFLLRDSHITSTAFQWVPQSFTEYDFISLYRTIIMVRTSVHLIPIHCIILSSYLHTLFICVLLKNEIKLN